MKILLFNLGPIQNRIIAWGVDGFKSLFEQDIILWGPVPDSSFNYNGKEIPIISFFEETNIKDEFKRLPENWIPDVVLCDTSVLNYIPDIYLCPVKTILFTRDSWSDTLFNRSLVELFDFTKYAVIDRNFYSGLHTKLLPLNGFAVSVPPEGTVNSEFGTRNIDLISIATLNDAFYHDRYKTLYNLAENNKSGLNVKFFRGIERSEIYSYYQRSKIVIDRSHTLSNRSFEAALNGCLLFSFEDNKLIEEFWIPWEEYIPYRDDNLHELVNYYIKNPEQSKQIIIKAHKKVFDNPANWGQMVWENIQFVSDMNINTSERINYANSLPLTDVIHRSATALLYNYEYNTRFPGDWEDVYFKRIDSALSYDSDASFRIKPLIEASRMAVLLKRNATNYLNELKQILPDYAWTYYLLARISYANGEYPKTIDLLNTAINCALRFPELLQKYVLPVIERGNSCDGRRITDFMWQPVLNHNNEFQVEAMLHLSYDLRGNAHQKTNEIDKAVNSYVEAINYAFIPYCLYKLGPLLIDREDFRKLLDVSEKGVENSPYDSIIILYKVYSLINLNQRMKAYKVLSRHRKALSSFKGVRKTEYIRSFLYLLMASIISGKKLSSIIIARFIRILKEKSVNSKFDQS